MVWGLREVDGKRGRVDVGVRGGMCGDVGWELLGGT